MIARCVGAWAVLCLVAACQLPPDATVRAIDIRVQVQPNGSVEVHEALEVERTAGLESRLVRRIGPDRIEAVQFRSAVVDGQTVSPGNDSVVDVRDRRSVLELTWRLPRGGAGGVHTLEWSYGADGVLAVQGARGTLRHAVLSGSRSAIGAARVQLAVPPAMHVFEGTGIAEAGWRVSRTSDGIVADRRNLLPGESVTIVAELGIDPSRIAEPAWQRHEVWGRELVPAFISGGLFILVIGAGVLWIIRFQYPRANAGEHDHAERDSVRRGLRTTGFVALALAVALAGVTWATLSHFGVWPQAIAASIAVVGLVFVMVARRIV